MQKILHILRVRKYLAFLVFTLCINFCAPEVIANNSGNNIIKITEEDCGKTIIYNRQFIEISMKSLRSAGYDWYIKNKHELEFVEKIGKIHNLIGGESVHTFYIKPQKEGFTIELIYKRAWESICARKCTIKFNYLH